MKNKVLSICFYVMAAAYAVIMLNLTLRFGLLFDTGREITRHYNIIPLRSIMGYLSGEYKVSATLFIINTVGNIAVFIPFGLYIQALRKSKNMLPAAFIVLLAPILVEAAQFAFGIGTCDIDDILLNFIGGLIGIGLYHLMYKLLKDYGKVRTAITAAAFVIGLPYMISYVPAVMRWQLPQ